MTISGRQRSLPQPAPGSYLELGITMDQETNILQVALPAVTIGQQVPLPQTLYIGRMSVNP